LAPVVGNTALAMDAWTRELNDTQDLPLLRGHAAPAQKVIPFTEIQRQAGRTPSPLPPPAPVVTPPSRPVAPQRKKTAGTPVEQGALDFTPVASAAPRTLTNGIPASNYCQRPVATLSHRLFASAVDIAMILIGFVLFVSGVRLVGFVFSAPDILGTGKPLAIAMGSIFLGVTAFYSIVWLFARRETAGMRVAGLELVTFDSTPLEMPTRIVRMATTWLSVAAGGLGIIWAIADEEKLTWQDHISKSFPTFKETGASFVRQTR